MDTINKYKIIKKIKSGGQGSVFLTKYNNKKYALKIEKIIEKDITKNLGSIYWREIEFTTYMNKKYPNLFLKLYAHDIVNNYNFSLDNPYKIEALAFLDFDMPNKIKELLDKYSNKNKSFESILESKLEGFYHDLGWSLNLNPYITMFFNI